MKDEKIKDEELAPVGASGVKRGEEVSLEDVLPYFKPFYIAKPYISLVGGLATRGKTKGDIDIYIARKTRDKIAEFRISRMLPEELASRLHFLYPNEEEDTEGVYTNNVNLYSLKLEASEERKIELMSADESKAEDAADKIELFKFRKLLKPAHGRYKGEMYSVDSLIELVDAKPEWYEKGIYVQKKFDGIHVRCDVKNGTARIWTEEGNEITDKLPTLVGALKKAAGSHNIVIVGELEFWKDKAHQSRQETTAIIHTKNVHEHEDKIILNAFDCLYYDKDIHDEAYTEREPWLRKLNATPKIQHVKSTIVKNSTDLRKAVKHYATEPGSEGAYLKLSTFPYELDGKTNLNIKYKNVFSIDAQVQDVHKVEGSESWNYLCSIKDGKRNVPIGRTYNTGIKLKEGDIVKVEFVNLNKYFDQKLKRTWYNWWSPRVIMAREDRTKPDNVNTADRLVKASHGEEKTKRSSVTLDADPYMVTPDEAKRWLGMLHMHVRGKSVHGDLRFQVTKDWAVGWTLYIPEGLSKVPESFSECKKLVDKEILPIVKAKFEDPKKRFNCGKKAVEDARWLDFQGMVQPGDIGATKKEPGFLYIVDRFDVEYGTQKNHYHEYFCNGKLVNGRVCVKLLENKKEWKKTGEGLMTWMLTVAEMNDPYVLSLRAVNKKWIPPFDRSALPEKMKSKVPDDYKYWLKRNPEDRRALRDELREALKKKQVELDAKGPATYRVLRQTWKKQTVIREEPSRTRFYFVICKLDEPKLALAFQDDPTDNKKLTGIKVKPIVELCKYEGRENSIKPGTELNRTKTTPSNLELIERGKATIIANGNVKTYEIKAGRMQGTWNAFNEEPGSVLWVLEKVRAP
ncbi:MAG: hypothetical protein U9N01_04615 [Euryarchaeota archaeon]|nr:hypothetical protein [Euryarchaeota archaeon]